MQHTQRKIALWLLHTAGDGISVWNKDFPQWLPLVSGRVGCWRTLVCAPSLYSTPPSSSQLHYCCCYVMSVCYEILHWKTRAHDHLAYTHTKAFHPLCVYVCVMERERANAYAVNVVGKSVLVCSCIQYICLCVCILQISWSHGFKSENECNAVNACRALKLIT